MLVQEVALSAAAILQADDLERALADSGEQATTDPDVKTMVKCVNLAVAELADDFPILQTLTAHSEGGVIPLSEFSDAPISVRGVKMYGTPVTFAFDDRGIIVPTDGEFTVVYTVETVDKSLNESVEVGAGVDGDMLVYLTARNYCLMTGRTDEASIWDQRYNAEAEKKRIARRARLPRRVWR